MIMDILEFSSKQLRDNIRRRMLFNSTYQEEIDKQINRKNLLERMKGANVLIDVLIISNVVLWIFGLALLIKYM